MPVLCWCLDIAHLDLFLRNQIGTVCAHKHILCSSFEVLTAVLWCVTVWC